MAINVQDQIDLLKGQLAEYEEQIPQDTDKINSIKNRISELEYENQQHEAAQQEREQQKKETIESTTSVDILAQIFGTLFPSDKYEVILGPNGYDVLSQDFKQIIQTYGTDLLQTAYQQQELVIAQKDEAIRELRKQKAEAESHLDATNDLLTSSQAVLEQKVSVAESLSKELINVQNQLSALQTEVADKDAQIAELQSKLEAAQKPKEESKPSQSLQDKLDQIKKKNELSADDWIARFNARQKSDEAKVQLPEIQQESPFPFPVTTEPENHQVPVTSEVQNVSEGQFPIITTPEIGPVEVPRQSIDGSVETETATKAWVKEQLAELRKELLGEAGEVA